jgi:hypothetical protein
MANIYQLLAEANGTQVSIPSSLSNPAASFTPPKYAIWVNACWFLSLAISLTCALLATLLQQWARRYIRATQPRYNPHKRGQIRAFFAEGVENLHLPWAVEALPALLHLSLFLFFTGLLVFLFNTHHNVFAAVAWWIGLCTFAYISITFMPLFRLDSPYYAPLSSSVWFVATGTLTLTFQLLYWLWPECFSDSAWDHFDERRRHYRSWFVHGLSKTAEEVARKLSPAIDGRALMWTLGCSDEEHELLRFFEGLPGFCNSKVLLDPIGTCIRPNMERIAEALIGLAHRTITSNLITPKNKSRRLVICREAMKAASLRTSPQIFRRIIDGEWDDLLGSFDFGLFLGSADNSDPVTAYHSQAILSIILPKVPDRDRDERWFQLATRHLDFPRPVLAHYLDQGDSMSFATSIRILRNIIHTHFDPFWLGEAATRWKVLELVTKFDVQGTLPTLQHDFCDLWNELVHMAKSGDPRRRSISIAILRNVRSAYIALHHGTDSAPTAFSSSTADDDHALILLSSYPTCNVSSHHPHPTSPTAHPHFTPGVPLLPTPQPVQLVLNLTSAAAMPAPPTAQTGGAPAFYVNVAATPHPITQDTPPAFPIPVPAVLHNNTMQSSLAPRAGSAEDPETDSSTSLSTFPVAFPQPIVAEDRGPTAAGEGSARVAVALRDDDASDPLSANPGTTVTGPAAQSPQQPPPPPPPRSSSDVAFPSPSLTSRQPEQRGNQLPHFLHGENTRKT